MLPFSRKLAWNQHFALLNIVWFPLPGHSHRLGFTNCGTAALLFYTEVTVSCYIVSVCKPPQSIVLKGSLYTFSLQQCHPSLIFDRSDYSFVVVIKYTCNLLCMSTTAKSTWLVLEFLLQLLDVVVVSHCIQRNKNKSQYWIVGLMCCVGGWVFFSLTWSEEKFTLVQAHFVSFTLSPAGWKMYTVGCSLQG